MELTLTAKLQLYPSPEQVALLQQTVEAYCQGCHAISEVVDTTHGLQQAVLQREIYRLLRTQFGLRSQMAQSVIKTVIARYKSVLANGQPWTRVQLTKSALDLVWNRDYSVKARGFSVTTLEGRVQVPFAMQGTARFFDGTGRFGTVHLVHRHGHWFLHEPMTKDVSGLDLAEIRQVVGLDFGINFLVTTYDSRGRRPFSRATPSNEGGIGKNLLPTRSSKPHAFPYGLGGPGGILKGMVRRQRQFLGAVLGTNPGMGEGNFAVAPIDKSLFGPVPHGLAIRMMPAFDARQLIHFGVHELL